MTRHYGNVLLTEESAACLALAHELLGPDIALLEMDTAIVDPEGTDVAVAVEPLGHVSRCSPAGSGG